MTDYSIGPAVAYRCQSCGGVVRTTLSGSCACRSLFCDFEQARFGATSSLPPVRVTVGPCVDDFFGPVGIWREQWLVVRNANLLRKWTAHGEPKLGEVVRVASAFPHDLIRFRGKFGVGFNLHVAVRASAVDELAARWTDDDLSLFLVAAGAGPAHRFGERADADDDLDARWASDVLRALQPAEPGEVPFGVKLACSVRAVALELGEVVGVAKFSS